MGMVYGKRLHMTPDESKLENSVSVALAGVARGELVDELVKRGGVTYMDVPEKSPHLSRCWSSLYDSEVATDDIGGVGPARIIVVQGNGE